jgi:hypothetical protein
VHIFAQVLPKERGLEAVACFDSEFDKWYLRLFRGKLGLNGIHVLENALERSQDEETKARLRCLYRHVCMYEYMNTSMYSRPPHACLYMYV